MGTRALVIGDLCAEVLIADFGIDRRCVVFHHNGFVRLSYSLVRNADDGYIDYTEHMFDATGAQTSRTAARQRLRKREGRMQGKVVHCFAARIAA